MHAKVTLQAARLPVLESWQPDVPLHGAAGNKSFTPQISLVPNSNSALKRSKEKPQARTCCLQGCTAVEMMKWGEVGKMRLHGLELAPISAKGKEIPAVLSRDGCSSVLQRASCHQEML